MIKLPQWQFLEGENHQWRWICEADAPSVPNRSRAESTVCGVAYKAIFDITSLPKPFNKAKRVFISNYPSDEWFKAFEEGHNTGTCGTRGRSLPPGVPSSLEIPSFVPTGYVR